MIKMERQVRLEDISDGKLYGLNDMVRADCNGCKGCSACCHGMGNSVILDPFDIYRMTTGIKNTFEELMQSHIELNVVDGIILPNLKMSGKGEACGFLNEEGRCSIHGFRPGFCRIFPLGRYYEDRAFHYILQIHECKAENRTKVKVKKWIDTPDLKRNEQFITSWHYLQKDLQRLIQEQNDDGFTKKISMHVLTQFYLTPYSGEQDFYEQFARRYEETKALFGL